MAKPYSILAAALVASGHSLSTVGVAAPIDCPTLRRTRDSRDWIDDLGGPGAFNFESPFAMDPLAERGLANAATLSE